MQSRPAPIVVFDLDGTLADTAHDLVMTLNVILAEEGLPALPVSDARTLIGAGARALIDRGFNSVGRELTAAHLDRLYRDFLAFYAENLCIETRLYPGAQQALARLEADGFRLAVCTNKIERHSVRLLEALGIADRFAAICGRDTFPFVKPDPRHLTMTIEKADGCPAQAVMVGDSRSDIGAAKAAGIPVVAVSFGYTDTPVHTLDPDRVIDRFDQLVDTVQDLLPLPVS